MKSTKTLLLNRGDVAALLSIDECIAAVEESFKLHAEGKIGPPKILGIHSKKGGFHIKACLLDSDKIYFAAKTNANFPLNSSLHGLPLIQGIITVFDGENGRLLALIDSAEITILRTGAATAVAAKYLALPDAKIATICGCGNQGSISLKALLKVRPLEKIYAVDTDHLKAQRFADGLSDELNQAIVVADNANAAFTESNIIVTCTPSNQPFVAPSDISAGTFIAAVGADSEEKQELEAELISKSKLVVDLIEQCATIGELRHALKKGLMTVTDVYASLGEIICGKKTGRTSDKEIIVFDSTGTALQDVATSVIVYEKAVKNGIGINIDFAA